MKLSVGYRLPDEIDSIYEICADYKERIGEVFFSWGSEPSGRSALCNGTELSEDEISAMQTEELKAIHDMGINAVLLLNANCYGNHAVSTELEAHVIEIAENVKRNIGLECVTTASPFIASVLKKHFGSDITLRASVNMRIGTIKGMEYLADYFDGFYMQRDYNRDFEHIKMLHSWTQKNKKTLHMLANSGCLSFCSFQTFHDNMVAHESEIIKENNAKLDFPAPCWKYLASLEEKELAAVILRNTWVRPEDIDEYSPYFETAKLATRIHSHPRMVVAAYAKKRFFGNLADITEPSYSVLLHNKILDSSALPKDWFEQVTHCNKNCHVCRYCSETAQKILRDVSDMMF